MKKMFMLLHFVMILLLVGCTTPHFVDGAIADDTIADDTTADDTIADDTTADDTTADDTIADDTVADGDGVDSDYTVTLSFSDGQTCDLTLGMEKSEVDKLFDELSVSFRIYGPYESQGIQYICQGVWLNFYKDDNDSWVLRGYEISTDRVSTKAGLAVGDSKEKLEQLYGELGNVSYDDHSGSTLGYIYFDCYNLYITLNHENIVDSWMSIMKSE